MLRYVDPINNNGSFGEEGPKANQTHWNQSFFSLLFIFMCSSPKSLYSINENDLRKEDELNNNNKRKIFNVASMLVSRLMKLVML